MRSLNGQRNLNRATFRGKLTGETIQLKHRFLRCIPLGTTWCFLRLNNRYRASRCTDCERTIYRDHHRSISPRYNRERRAKVAEIIKIQLLRVLCSKVFFFASTCHVCFRRVAKIGLVNVTPSHRQGRDACQISRGEFRRTELTLNSSRHSLCEVDKPATQIRHLANFHR